MVLSTSPSAPVTLIVGIGGNQGGSVARALIASPKPYNIIGISRDLGKPTAKAWIEQGIALREVTIGPANAAAVMKAFEGVSIVFATTISNDGNKERELSEGKLMIDAAVASKVKLFVWTGHEPIAARSGGKYTNCGAGFDSKAEITEYLKASGLPWAIVPCGSFSHNFLGGWFTPAKQEDGTYLLRLPISPNSTNSLPLLDPAVDYGVYVQAAIEVLGAGSEVLTGALTTPSDLVKAISEVTGETVRYEEVNYATFYNSIGGEHNPMAAFIADMFGFFGEFGYYGGKDVGASQAASKVTPRPWRDIVAAHKAPLVKEM